MPQNFKPVEREQCSLLPESVADWLPKDHFAWFLIDAVEAMDLSAFLSKYREDGTGQSAYHPTVMVGVLLYAYCSGERSSRQIEKRCLEDVAYRVVAANYQPDHATLARFRANFEKDLGDLFFQILKLCQAAGLVKAGTVALDGTKIRANAAMDQNRTLKHLQLEAQEMLAEAAQTDAREDALFGQDKRGDELPEDMRDPRSRRRRLKECLERLEREAQAAREAQQALIDAREKAEAEGKRFKGPRFHSAESKVKHNAKANLTDPQSRIMKTRRGKRQCYNAQALVTEQQIILAADATQEENDYHQALPMLRQAQENLAATRGQALYKKRSQTVEPVFGQIKTVLKGGRSSRRGWEAMRQEWRLTCAASNFRKLWISKRAEQN